MVSGVSVHLELRSNGKRATGRSKQSASTVARLSRTMSRAPKSGRRLKVSTARNLSTSSV